MVENAAHPGNFAMQRFDTPFLSFVGNIRRNAAKWTRPRGDSRRY